MDERERRIGLNEAIFREVNERLRDVNEAFATITNTMELVCECGKAECTERISMSPGDYERVRAEPDLFAIIPGHEIGDVEQVVEQASGYDVVRKHSGPPHRLAEATDPR